MNEQREEQLRLVDAVSQWGNVLSLNHIDLEKEGHFCREKWKFVADNGLFGIAFTTEHGGMGYDLLTLMKILEMLGYVSKDGGLNFVITSHIVSLGVLLNRFGSEQQKKQYLPKVCDGSLIGAHAISEPDSGSDAFAMRTTAKLMQGGYVLNGSKTFISNAPIAGMIVVYAMTDRKQGALGGCSVFLVDTKSEGLSIGKPLDKMGLKNAPMSELYFSECFVPESHVVGKIGDGFGIFQHIMNWEILCSFVVNVGEMQRRYEACLKYVKMRKAFGAAIGKNQSISHQLVDMKISLETSRDWLYRAGDKFLSGKNANADIAIAKLVCSEANLDSATRTVRLFGGYGYLCESGWEKEYRQAIAGTIYSGTSEITRNKIASMIGL